MKKEEFLISLFYCIHTSVYERKLSIRYMVSLALKTEYPSCRITTKMESGQL